MKTRVKVFNAFRVAMWSAGWMILTGISQAAAGAPERLSLWQGQAPAGGGEFVAGDAFITVHQPEKPTGAAIVICPGGGYGGLVTGGEGHGIARWLNAHGIVGVVLEYRLPRGNSAVPLLDAQRAIRTVRAHAAEWHCDPDRIGIVGFSAGGHLASTAATHFDGGDVNSADAVEKASSRPDFAILIYPVITMGPKTHGGSRRNLLGPNPTAEAIANFSNETQVTKETPPVFLAHALDDHVVPAEHSQMFFDALQANGVPAKYLKLPSGGHGLNGYKGPMWDAWQTQSLEWLKSLGEGTEKKEKFGWLESIKSHGYTGKGASDLVAWCDSRFRKGETTPTEIVAIFGKPLNSDVMERPSRDQHSLVEYTLIDDGANVFLFVFHFSDGVLSDYGTHMVSICGFCPHVFVDDDGQWRLEGKMLAGRVGKDRAGADTMLLPRLQPRDGLLTVKLANIAAEIEFIETVALTGIPLRENEELDISVSGEPVVWTPLEEIPVALPDGTDRQEALSLTGRLDGDVVVFEVRNTPAFERVTRAHFLDGQPVEGTTALRIDFGSGGIVDIPAVGTKLLRRVVVAIPLSADRISVVVEGDYWFCRRLWTGRTTALTTPVRWREPAHPRAIRLEPWEETALVFPVLPEDAAASRLGYALRMSGYYDFIVDRKAFEAEFLNASVATQ